MNICIGGTIMNFETYEFKYKTYLESLSRNQSDIIRYTSVCACLESGDFDRINMINEAAMDSIKNAIKKIIEAIRGLWRKFAERANEILTTDLAYLSKYKDTIQKNAPKSKEITWYNYDLTALVTELPIFKYDDKMKNWLDSDDAKSTFFTTFLPSLNVKSNDDTKEAFEERIRGENQVEVDGKNIDIKGKLYNYCVDYKKTVEKIMKNRDNMDKAEAEINKIIGQMSTKFKEAPNTEPEDKTNLKQEEIIPTESFVHKYGKYFTEADKQTIGKASKEVSSGTTVSTNTPSLAKNTADTLNTSVATKGEYENLDKATVYFRCCGDMIAAQLTVAQEIQKNYMAIIRAHVRDYVADAN